VIRSHQPDLVIADIDLSEMDGVAFRRELAREVDTDIVPFVFLAGDEDGGRIAEIDDLGYDDVVSKPPQPAALRGTVRRLIARYRRLREAFVAKATRSASYSIASNIPDEHGPFRISAHVASASAGGGDLIHASELGDRLLLLVADVMGHGMAARFYAHGVTAYFRSIIASAEPDTPLETVMTSLSDALFDDPTFERTTVSAQLIELLPDGSVGICSAAHPFPLLMTQDLVRWIEVSGPLPALGPSLPFPSKTLAPAPGTRFGFYTDGLYEIGALRRDPVAAGARLFDLFGRERETPLEGAAERIIARHTREVGSLPDDASVMIVERV
jgi:sigma-B regulation protein RsbU (phosphoserine phosphatase)